MCGIAGIVALEGFDPALLISMTDLVEYRGPDGYGFVYFDGQSNFAGECFHNKDGYPSVEKPPIGLGTRRLAILDLSEMGNQPMQIENGNYWITYNGEVYNYLEIRKELERLGHSFRTRTDTEVILRAYTQWGALCVNRFNGMWSFAIWDRTQRKLFCSRDRFGVKPFYYYVASSVMVFGSEIKQILHFPGIPRTVNETIVARYLEQGVQDHSDETFFAGIRELAGGHSLTVDLSKPMLSVEIKRYWDLPIEIERNISEREAIEEFATLFQRAVVWRMRSDVPVGSCLSGGLDSSSVVTQAARTAQATTEFHVFSSCFEDADIDERKFIREVVSCTGAISHLIFPKEEDFWDELECMIWHQDEPVGGTSVYAQWCVMRAARQAGVPVLLDGQGGDEILCGYRKFYLFYLWHLFRQMNPQFLAEGIRWIRNSDGGTIWNWSSAKRYVPFSIGPNGSLLARLGNTDFARKTHQLGRLDLGPGTDLRQRQKADLTCYSIPTLLRYEDRNSMAHSVEARVPMLDYQLAQFAVNCPPSLKLRDGWTKWILRQALRGTLPEPVRLRKSKLGFATPQKKWLRQDIRGVIRSLINGSDMKMSRFLSTDKVCREFRRFLARKSACITDVEAFRVLSLEVWARVFKVE